MDSHLPDGATPLDLNAIAGLIPNLSTQGELDEWEQRNITDALRWAGRSRTLKRDFLTATGLRLLHQRMFGQTWRWAGELRRTQTNIGVPSSQIAVQMASLCDDVRYQVANGVLPWAEVAARFHHRLVSIPPFPNGNGRHARLSADLLMEFHGQPIFSWGAASAFGSRLNQENPVRRRYIAALRAADGGDLEPLLAFGRS